MVLRQFAALGLVWITMQCPAAPASSLDDIALTAAVSAPEVDGIVQKVEVVKQRLTLKQGAIDAYDMPNLTMRWRLQDPTVLQGLAEGDKVHITVGRIDSQYTILSLRKLSAP